MCFTWFETLKWTRHLHLLKLIPWRASFEKIFSSWKVSKWLIVALSSAWILHKKKWKEKLEEFSTYFYRQTTLIKVNTAKVRRTVWKQWKFLFKYFSWHILKVLIATITRETSEILKNPKSDVSTRRHSILINWALNQTIPPPAPFLQVFFK